MAARNQHVEVNADVERFVNSTKEKAESHVKVKFPTKIVQLTGILESSDFSVKDPAQLQEKVNIPVPDPLAISRGCNNHCNSVEENEVSGATPTRGKRRRLESNKISEDTDDSKVQGTKILALTSGPVFCNSKITRLIDIVKPHICELVDDSNLLKMWITFLIPKIEDGNNFGVSIQEDTLGEIRTVEAEAASFYEQISRYYAGRGKIISKVAKYPHIDDYRRLVDELDEKEFLSLRIVLSEIRNHYASLYDLITKNMEKIVRPRTSNAENLY